MKQLLIYASECGEFGGKMLMRLIKRIHHGMPFLVILTGVALTQEYQTDTLQNIRYADCERCVGDLYLPVSETDQGPYPVVIVMHGGGWGGGSKDKDDYKKMAANLVTKGIAGFSINYTLSGELPEPVYDAKAAVRFLRRMGPEYGLDPCNIGASGGSAGGWSTSYLAWTRDSDVTNEYSWDPKGREHWGYPANIQVAVPLSGAKPLNVEEMEASELPTALMMSEGNGKREYKIQDAYVEAGLDALVILGLDGHGSTLLFKNEGKFDTWLEFFADNLNRACKTVSGPKEVSVSGEGEDVVIEWQASDDHEKVYSYAIFRDEEEIGWSRSLSFQDTAAPENIENVEYSVAAISKSGILSEKIAPGDIPTTVINHHGVINDPLDYKPRQDYTVNGKKQLMPEYNRHHIMYNKLK